ncbi:MAG: hypothetical protein ABF391_03225 [Akkermansiaceae bacterium]
MPPLRPFLSVILPLSMGVGLLLGLPHLAPLVRFEHFSFLFPERFQNDRYFADRGGLNELKITVLDFSADPDAKLNLESYLLDEEALDIMGPEGGKPIEWAQFLAQTRLDDDRLTVITSSLSWDDATEIALLALQEQVDSTPSLVIGIQGEFINSEATLPDYLKDSVLPLKIPDSFDLPEIDHIQRPPSINSSSFGISEIRGLKLEPAGELKLIPMLVRWGDQTLPTLPLASLLKSHRLSPTDLILDEEGYLRLGREGSILKLDHEGRTALPMTESPQQSASKLQIYPKQAEIYKIISPQDAPKATRSLKSQIQQALSQKPRQKTTYQRWPLPFELGLLLTSILLLHLRKFWVAPLILVAAIGGSVLADQWVLLSPLALVIIAFQCFPPSRPVKQKS